MLEAALNVEYLRSHLDSAEMGGSETNRERITLVFLIRVSLMRNFARGKEREAIAFREIANCD